MTPLDRTAKKTKVIHVRVTEEEQARVKRLAAKSRRSVTQFILWLVEKEDGGR